MTIQGLRHTENFAANERPQNWREGILRLEPNGKAPLFALTSMMKSQETDDPAFHWFEKIMPSRRLSLSGGAIGVGGTLTVGQTGGVNNALIAGIRAQHLLRIEHTGEVVLVTTDPVSGVGTIAVTRGYFAGSGGVAATSFDPAAAGSNPNIHVIGTLLGENSMPPTSVNFDPVERYNYTQIQRDTLSMSRTAQQTRLRTGDQVKEAKRECLEMHSAALEWSMWFGERNIDTAANGEPRRAMDGVFRQIARGAAANVINHAGAVVSLAVLEDWMEQAFRYGSSEKMAFIGNAGALTIQRLARKNSSYQFMQGQKEYGMDVSRLISPFGTLVLKTHPLWNQITSGSTAATPYYALNTWMAILDMKNLRYRYMKGGDTQYQPKLQDNGLDGMLSGYLTECSIELNNPITHLVIKGMGAGAVDA